MLSENQKQFYADNGYIVLDDIFTEEELQELSEDYNDVFARAQGSDLEATWQGNWRDEALKNMDTFSVLSIHNLQYHNSSFTRMLLNKKMLGACSDVMGTKNILLHHTKAHIKPPRKGAPFPMHQDYHYFPMRDDSMVAVFVHLDAADVDNGCLSVYPASHKLGPQRDCSSAVGWHHVDQEKFPISGGVPLQTTRGQVVIFSYLLIHGSYPNISSRIRRMLLVQLMSADDAQLKVTHVSPGQGLCLLGCNSSAESDIKRRHGNHN